MFCTKCGNELPVNAKFCTKCGTKVEAFQPGAIQPNPTPQRASVPQQESTQQQTPVRQASPASQPENASTKEVPLKKPPV